MPPIVALTIGAPLTSMGPVLVKPFPVMLYVTALMVTPGATFKLRPSEPT
jgi:hypothetical protein